MKFTKFAIAAVALLSISATPSIAEEKAKKAEVTKPAVAKKPAKKKRSFLSAYKRSADKEACLINIQSIQKAMRSFANIENIKAGEAFDAKQLKVIFKEMPTCPTDGSKYIYLKKIPAVGTPFAKCPNCDTHGHKPANTKDW